MHFVVHHECHVMMMSFGAVLSCHRSDSCPLETALALKALLAHAVPGQLRSGTPQPMQRAGSARSGSDVSMESAGEGQGSQHSDVGSGPDVQALGAALEQLPEPTRLKVCGQAPHHWSHCSASRGFTVCWWHARLCWDVCCLMELPPM